jgi:uracil-DNA glycosylase family 4
MDAIGLSREKDLFICNIVKCRPPQNRDPLPEEKASCIPFLKRQIELVRPQVVLCLGRVAAQMLLQTDQGLGALRGRVHTWEHVPLLVTYHPSAVLRFPENYRRPVWEDLQQLKDLLPKIEQQR